MFEPIDEHDDPRQGRRTWLAGAAVLLGLSLESFGVAGYRPTVLVVFGALVLWEFVSLVRSGEGVWNGWRKPKPAVLGVVAIGLLVVLRFIGGVGLNLAMFIALASVCLWELAAWIASREPFWTGWKMPSRGILWASWLIGFLTLHFAVGVEDLALALVLPLLPIGLWVGLAGFASRRREERAGLNLPSRG